jgi:hypothetical protein
MLCQQRKVKCDRKFPCANCIRTRAQCVPATLAPRQRRRRFAERELLERLRNYEHLLRKNNIDFQPLHEHPARENESLNVVCDYDSDDEHLESSSTTVLSESIYGAKYAFSLEAIAR